MSERELDSALRLAVEEHYQSDDAGAAENWPEPVSLPPAEKTIDDVLEVSGVAALVEGSDIGTVEAALRRLGELLIGCGDKLRRAAIRTAAIAQMKS